MSRKPDDLTDYRFVEYAPPSYDDPRFYEPRQEDPPPPSPRDVAQTFPTEEDSADGTGEAMRAEGDGQEVERRGSKKKLLGGLGAAGVAIAGLLVKFKMILIVLLDIKWVAALSKFGLASISAFISAAVYARFFGWSFAIGFVLLLLIHEMGHAVIMKLKGIPFGGMIFIPMLGAAVFMKRRPGNVRDEAEVGIAGPIAGALASLAALLIAYSQANATGSAGIWAPLAYFGCFLNLFNLIPIVPFDGGRVLAAIDRRVWLLGFLVLVAIQVWQWWTGNSSLWLLIFIVIAAADFWARRSTGKTPGELAYYAVPLGERIIIGLAYFALAVALVMGMTLAHGLLFTSAIF